MKYFLTLLIFLCACSEAKRQPAFLPPDLDKPVEGLSLDDDNYLKQATVGLVIKSPQKERFFCSGVIVDDIKIITAVHCVHKLSAEQKKNFFVGFGKNLKDHTRKVIDIAVPHHWKKRDSVDLRLHPFEDVAILTLESAIPTDRNPKKSFHAIEVYNGDLDKLIGQPVYVFGYGAEREGSSKGAGVINGSKGRVRKVHYKGMRRGFLQALFTEKPPCNGDSGGGMFIKDGDTWKLLATASGSYLSMNDVFRDKTVDIILGKIDSCEAGDVSYTVTQLQLPFLKQQVPSLPQYVERAERKDPWAYESITDYCNNGLFTTEEQRFIHSLYIDGSYAICDNQEQLDMRYGSFPGTTYDHAEYNNLGLLRFAVMAQVLTIKNVKAEELPFIDDYFGVYDLYIENSSLESLASLGNLRWTKKISIEDTEVKDKKSHYAIFANESLEEITLQVDGLTGMPTLNPNTSRLTYIHLAPGIVNDLNFVTGHQFLKNIQISESRINDLTPLANIKTLEVLSLGANEIEDITPLKDLKLTHLFINHNKIKDVSALSNALDLIQLYIGANDIRDLRPLLPLEDSLRELNIGGNPRAVCPFSSWGSDCIRNY